MLAGGGIEKPIRVGVLGGGQLGRMMATPAHRLGIELVPLDPLGEKSPAGLLCSRALEVFFFFFFFFFLFLFLTLSFSRGPFVMLKLLISWQKKWMF